MLNFAWMNKALYSKTVHDSVNKLGDLSSVQLVTVRLGTCFGVQL